MKALVVAALLVLAAVRGADAHDLRPGVLSLREVAPGEYTARFSPPIDSRGEATEVTYTLEGGIVDIAGMRGDAMKTVVVLVRLDGTRAEWILDAANPRIELGRAPPAGFVAWIRVGITHILAGLDHLAFVVGLLLVLDLALNRRLLLTITAFTLAHSLTLALAVLGVVHVRSAPVEACIALSVLLVAREALHREPTAIRRWPWLAAGGFGLVHGLGFASALADVGLPRESLASSLAAFNIGVELGQLAVVVAIVGGAALVRRLIGERRVVWQRVHRTTCYALGALAAWWFVARVVDLAR
jgi:hypothetical protein